MPTDREILDEYLSNSKGIRGAASVLGVSRIRVGRVVKAYLDGRLRR